jgi:hypothetical protein
VSNRRIAQFAVAVALGLVAVLAGAAWAEDNAVTSTNVPVESNSSVLAIPYHAGVPTGSTIPPGGPSNKVIVLWVTVFTLGAVAIILLAYLQKRRVEAYRHAADRDKREAGSKATDDGPPGEDS